MNTLAMRRRWLVVRPWLSDTAAAIGGAATLMAAMWVLSIAVEAMRAKGWL